MHTLATRMSARERELAPRYYYKRANSTTWLQKIKNALRAFFSFLFTQVSTTLFYTAKKMYPNELLRRQLMQQD
jgi:hypothetical protein